MRSHTNDRVTGTRCCFSSLFEAKLSLYAYTDGHLFTLTCLCKHAHAEACMCDMKGSREERIETEVEQEQGHPFKSSLQRLCPTFLFVSWEHRGRGGKKRDEERGMGQGIKTDSDVGGRGRSILPLKTSPK